MCTHAHSALRANEVIRPSGLHLIHLSTKEVKEHFRLRLKTTWNPC
jgi:hypothetical protein